MRDYTALLMLDLDNTVYNWVDFFAPCFRAMVHVLARETGLPEADIIADFKDVYGRHRSVEYPFSIQKLRLSGSRSEAEVAELIRAAMGAFKKVRRVRLCSYAGVRESLQWMRARNVAVVAVTNSPLYLGRARIKQLHLANYFLGIAAWEGWDLSEDDPFVDSLRERDRHSPTQPLSSEWPLPRASLKPRPDAYERIMSSLAMPSSRTIVMGDSQHKDLIPAAGLGCTTVWAEFGTHFDARNFQTLLDITHWTDENIERTYSRDCFAPDAVASRFEDIVDVVDGVLAPRLF